MHCILCFAHKYISILQLLMNALLTMEDVNMNVLIMLALMNAGVEVDSDSPATGDRALVTYSYTAEPSNRIELFINSRY